ncbi:Postreplication repair E3 ubiquitin-protein ligase RAD18 [Gracilariopsis chorda]|uniref:Postreplication repair E3 ubiquitin-protein ligase RAD18 n=1 Tax=Gracilariopsis chorda TaxID=448386 RepID=A0A2V3IME0_9FLOR|nr:Postreplication repair E3 ubiquitin-protein ligase RAD18 [Gracilariopsis chorda]|eukprot:PXF43219.1 Postreplication repair E3 ubiquitin-protein ligase RAD18 [Gracilariopsis chorda]
MSSHLSLHSANEKDLINFLEKSLHALAESHNCPICHDMLNAPVRLPCHHIFCSLCIRRHLTRSSICPYPTCRRACTSSALVALRNYDAHLAQLRHVSRTQLTPSRTTLAQLPLPGSLSRPNLVKKLSKAGLSAVGTVEVLSNRYREYVLRYNAAADSASGASKQALADAVRRYEDALSANQATMDTFFEKVKDESTVKRGDNFEDLVRKTRQRNHVERRSQATQEGVQNSRKPNGDPEPDIQPQKCDTSGGKRIRAPRDEANDIAPKRPCSGQAHIGRKTTRNGASPTRFSKASCSDKRSQHAVKSASFDIQPYSSYLDTPSSENKNTQLVATPSTKEAQALTREQEERIQRNMKAAMEKRQKNSQSYVRRLSFTS